MIDRDILHRRMWVLAHNLWWTWHPEVADLFQMLDPVRWRVLGHSPAALLLEFPPERLEERVSELSLHGRVHYAYRRLQEYLKSRITPCGASAGPLWSRPVAYFSAEFGLHESFPIYSGGLGVLSGDHLKSASDLGIPLVAVGLFYDQGYFVQSVNREGWQQEAYVDTDVSRLPMQLAQDPAGQPITVEIATRASVLRARVWTVAVGRTRLLLLDSDVEGNRDEDRQLTARLYGGDDRVRIRQELLLGVGGVRALHAAGISPGVIHLNEGHSAFAPLEAALSRMKIEGISFDEARRRVSRNVVFTTHTPVPAGHDCFHGHLIEEHLGPLRDELGLDLHGLMRLGRVRPDDDGEPFSMTVLALKMSRHANGVSALHGQISRQMWMELWPGRAEHEVPIGHITNGVHVFSWLAPQMRQLYDRYFSADWQSHTADAKMWEAVDGIEPGELWETHQALKAELIEFARHRAIWQRQKRNEPDEIVEQVRRAFSTETLLIGFARRFATYKRATLFLRDLDRLDALVNDPLRPVHFLFAGKAHPRDDGAKALLQQIARLTKEPRFAGKIVFLEDYDMGVGRQLVRGVDVWLNNPRRPLEASGTSGQKVVLNGGLNLSILDGWWAEAYDGRNGFALGNGEVHSNVDFQDDRDGEALLRALTHEVVPMYYDRDQDGLPRRWIDRMKHSIRTLGWRYNADRMVSDYLKECYLPAVGAQSCDMRRL